VLTPARMGKLSKSYFGLLSEVVSPRIYVADSSASLLPAGACSTLLAAQASRSRSYAARRGGVALGKGRKAEWRLRRAVWWPRTCPPRLRSPYFRGRPSNARDAPARRAESRGSVTYRIYGEPQGLPQGAAGPTLRDFKEMNPCESNY
jgi:hypothetical protein